MILFTGLTGTSGSAFVDVLQSHNYKEHFRVLVRETSNIEQLKNEIAKLLCNDECQVVNVIL